MTRGAVLLLSIGSIACSTAPAPKPVAAPLPVSVLEPSPLESELQAARAAIAARESAPPAAAPRVDLEAAASIPIPVHPSIDSAVRLFTRDLKPSIQESLIRSAKYKKLIDQALGELDLPKGLAYLPVIESAYLPTLTSRAGAHGIWQFMPDTAREYGLRVDWWVDERADPERSTRAAATYLKDLYRQFNDWPLALAAYNAGPGRVRRALDSSGATTFWELLEGAAVPKETRGYVPTFFATLLIASDPATYGFRLGEAREFDHKRVEVEGPLSLEYVAEVAQVEESLLREMNPALRRGIVPPGRASIRVPAKAAETIASRAATLKNDDANVAVCSFTLRDGDSLRRIARSIGSSVDTLLAMNNLRSADRAGEGDSLYLPVRARELGALLAHRQETLYAVKKGDTVFSIARKHNLTVDELLDLNQLDRSDKLHAGDRLRVSPPRALTAGGM
jgi:membrane-bound lytic murein transglycosylase D